MKLSLLSLVLAASAVLPAATVEGPCVDYVVAGTRGSLCGQLSGDGKTFEFSLANGQPIDILDSTDTLLARITSLSIGGNIDPFISYGIAVVDFGAASDFVFSFSTPIVPGAYTHAFSSLSGSLTDGGSNGSSASPIGPALVMQTSEAGPGATDLGVGVGPGCVGAAGTSSICPPSTLHNFGVAGGPFSTLTIRLAFTGSGGGDVITFSGRTDLDAVPEPSTALLGGAALLAFAAARRIRR